jgi:hypothetical protein
MNTQNISLYDVSTCTSQNVPYLNPGDKCSTYNAGPVSPRKSPCVTEAMVDFKCPNGNDVQGAAPELVDHWNPQTYSWEKSYYPLVICKACQATLTEDVNMGENTFTGTLSFGPNQVNDSIDETDIVEYKVYFTDSDHVPIELITTTPKLGFGKSACGCTGSEYTVDFNQYVSPVGAAYVMVTMIDTTGYELPIGTYVPFTDYYTTTTTTETSVTTTTKTTVTTETNTETTIVKRKAAVGSSGAVRVADTRNLAGVLASLVMLFALTMA